MSDPRRPVDTLGPMSGTRSRSLIRKGWAAAALLALGAATTVGVAWTLAVTLDMDGSRAGFGGPVKGSMSARARNSAAGEGSGWLTVERFSRRGAVFFETYVQPGTGEGSSPPNEVALHAPVEKNVPAWAWRRLDPGRGVGWPGPDETSSAQLDARGWPFVCLSCSYSMETDATFSVVAVPQGAIRVAGLAARKGRWSGTYPAALPLRPIWGAFAANTGIYAATWWVLAMLPIAIRGRARLLRGRCAACGYDRQGLQPGAACPECGTG